MSETRWITAGAAVFCALAAVSRLGPEADAVVTTVVLAVLGVGALAGACGYLTHVRRIRREIEAGRGMVMRKETPPSPTLRRPVCRHTRRGPLRTPRCRPGRRR